MSRSERSCDELKARAEKLLKLDPSPFREKLIKVSAEKSPSAAYKLAYEIAKNHGQSYGSDRLAKATRWLAVIRRDHPEEFAKITTKPRGIALAGKEGEKKWGRSIANE